MNTKHVFGRVLLAVFTFTSVRPVSAFPQSPPSPLIKPAPPSPLIKPVPSVKSIGQNGITVGPPDSYDVRKLKSDLAALDVALRGIAPIDSPSLSAALGKFQGAVADRSSVNASIVMTPTPGIEHDVTSNAYGDSSKPSTPPLTSQDVTKTTTSSVTPSPPAPLTQTSMLTSPGVTYGESAGDLLTDQISLKYQAMTLSLLLQHSLNDQLFLNSGPWKGHRQEAVIGFPVSIAPTKDDRGKVAQVDITITPNDPTSEPIQLISLMPESKTYNVATTTNRATGFGVGAVIEPFNVGVNTSSQHETMYLVRDIDTVALRPQPATSNTVSFSWQFRPVLGRKAIDPGVREVFAVLALPVIDGVATLPYNATVKIHTSWKDYDARAGVAYSEVAGSENAGECPYSAPPEINIEDALTPKVIDATWTTANNGRVLVQLTGENYQSDTGVIVGDTVLGTADGFTILHDNRISFLIQAAALINSTPLLDGSEGGPKPISKLVVPGSGFVIDSVSPAPEAVSNISSGINTTSGINIPVTIYLKGHDGASHADLTTTVAPDILVDFGGTIFGMSDHPIVCTPADGNKLATITFSAPASLVQQARRVHVTAPFYGPAYDSVKDLSLKDDFDATKAVLLTSNAGNARYGIVGNNFQKGLTVFVGQKPYSAGTDKEITIISPTLVTLDLTPLETRGLQQFLINQGTRNAPILLPVSAPAAVPAPAVSIVPEIDTGSVTEVTLQGVNLNNVAKVTYLKTELLFKPSDDGKSLTLLETPELAAATATAGKHGIVLVSTDGTPVPVVLVMTTPKP